MDPQQQPPQMPNAAPQPPASFPEQPLVPETPRKSHRKLVGILLIAGPTALILGSVLLYAVVNFLVNANTPTDGSGLVGDQPVIVTVLNLVLFLCGAVSVLAWLPCLIIGIVLLATQKK